MSKKPARGPPASRDSLKAKNRLARKHLKVSRQRKDHAMNLARCVIRSHDLVAYEDLQIRNMVRTHPLARSISDARWSQFRVLLEDDAKVHGKVVVAVSPQFTSVLCSQCGQKVHQTCRHARTAVLTAGPPLIVMKTRPGTSCSGDWQC